MEKLAPSKDRSTKGTLPPFSIYLFSIDGLKISNSQVKRLERELKNLKEEVRTIIPIKPFLIIHLSF